MDGKDTDGTDVESGDGIEFSKMSITHLFIYRIGRSYWILSLLVQWTIFIIFFAPNCI